MKQKIIMLLLGCAGYLAQAQQILLDKPVRAGELTLFPTVSDLNSYYYLPDKPRIGISDGFPQFSFLRYVKNSTSEKETNDAISESAFGGGIVHALIELSVSNEQIRSAENTLKRINGNAKIVGPVIFKSGTIALISTVAQPGGESGQKVIGLGHAPILENQKAAVSVQLNKLNSKILWESFNTRTPDFSFNFEMEVEGYLSPKRIIIEADFQRIYKNQTIQAAVVSPVLAAEINSAMDELYDSGAIKITQIGTDEDLNRLRQTAYEQLVNLIFDKVGGTGVPQLNQILPNNQRSILDRATDMLREARTEARTENRRIDEAEQRREERAERMRERALSGASRIRQEGGLSPLTRPQETPEERAARPQRESIPALAVAVSYQQKQIKQTGKYTIDLNKYTETTRSIPFAFNPGNVKTQCAACFKEVNLDDPLMKQRDITTSLGGINTEDFSGYINFVNVIVKKKHQTGEETVQEIKIDKAEFNKQGNLYKMIYGWKGDDNRNKWLDYEYKTLWSFKGNHQIESSWTKNTFSSINLEPPFNRKNIYIEVDQDFIAEQSIKGIEIKFTTQIGESQDVKTVNLKTNNNELTSNIQILLPLRVEQFDYEVTYFSKGKEPIKSRKVTTTNGRIDIDKIL